MPLRNTASRATASSSADTMSEEHIGAQEALAAQQAEIEKLRALLAAAEERAARTETTLPAGGQMVTMSMEDIVQALARPQSTLEKPKRSAKIPDPATLIDGRSPTFESWKIQVQDKLEINADHFLSERARKAYVFACTGGDAQSHLQPRYSDDSAEPFALAKDMIDHLASIYEDPYKVRNARYEYKNIRMRANEQFTDFQTRFLQLAGRAHIPTDDLLPDLFDKLTPELSRTVLSQYSTMTTLKQLTDHCRAIDQGLRRIKANADRISKSQAPATSYKPQADHTKRYGLQGSPTDRSQARTPEATPLPDRSRGPTPTSWRSRTATPAQANSYQCYSCGQEGHFTKECPTRVAKSEEVALVHDSYNDSGLPESEFEEELEEKELEKEQP